MHILALVLISHWLYFHFVGSQAWVNFWGGIASDVGEITLIGAVIGMWHKHVCHDAHCWRIGRHVVDGTPWCNKHHMSARQKLADTGSAHGIVAQNGGTSSPG